MEYTLQQQKLINRVYCLFLDHLMCLDTWGYYLQNEPKDLRHKLGIIWLGSLFDTIEAETKYIPKYKKEAIDLELCYLERYLNQALELIKIIKEILMFYSKEEQVFISYLRNQSVHCYLNGRHSDSTIKIKYVNDFILEIEDVDYDTYHQLTRELFKPNNNVSKKLDLSLDSNQLYWQIMGEIQLKHSEMYKSMKEKQTFDWQFLKS